VTEWTADKVERRSVASLIPFAKNSRTHGDEQIAQVAASIPEWGWTNPVLVSEDGTIIAGHARVLAARKLGDGRPRLDGPTTSWRSTPDGTRHCSVSNWPTSASWGSTCR
jgi:hypothetical protein